MFVHRCTAGTTNISIRVKVIVRVSVREIVVMVIMKISLHEINVILCNVL